MRDSEKPASEVSGVAADGDISVSGGQVAGRDIWNLIVQAFPPDDPRSDQLKNAFGRFREHYHHLYEWKELHHHLHHLWDSLTLLGKDVQVLDLYAPAGLILLEEHWDTVHRSLDDLFICVNEMAYIDTPHRPGESVKLWIEELKVLQSRIQQAVEGYLIAVSRLSPEPIWIWRRLFMQRRLAYIRKEQGRPLQELVKALSEQTRTYLSVADAKVRATTRRMDTVFETDAG